MAAPKKQVSKPGDVKPNPKDVYMGSGAVNRARRAVAGRGRQIDDVVEQAERGTLSTARRPRAY